MAKTKTNPKASGNQGKATPKENTMNTIPTPPTTQAIEEIQFTSELFADVKASWNGPKSPLVVYFDSEPWNQATDLSLFKFGQMRPGLSAIAKFGAGEATGSPKLVVTAPEEKLGYENGTGTFAYVHASYVPVDDAVEINVNGTKVLLDVDAKYIPAEGWQRLSLAPGFGLYADPTDGVLTPAGEFNRHTGELKTRTYLDRNGKAQQSPSAWQYWYIQTIATLLGRHNVSVSTNVAEIANEAERVFHVLNADDRQAANDTRRFENRQDHRDNVAMKDNAESLRLDSPQFQAPKGSLVLPLEMDGEFDLSKAKVGEPITPVTSSGLTLGVRRLRVGDEAERFAMYQLFTNKGWKVRL